MSQHGCPERLSNRSKGFQEDGPSQPTIEVLVETLTGTAFEMTVSPSDTVYAIKSKIFRVEGIPISQQHLLFNLKELDDSTSLREHSISDGARLRLVLGMRGGPISTRRLPVPAPDHAEPWPDIDRLLDVPSCPYGQNCGGTTLGGASDSAQQYCVHPEPDSKEEGNWSGGGGFKVTVLVFRDGERVNMLRVKENQDGTYSPIDSSNLNTKYSSSLSQLAERPRERECGADSLLDNVVTQGKMLEIRRRMETLSLQRQKDAQRQAEKVDIQKTRSEETLSVPSLLDDSDWTVTGHAYDADDTFAPLYDGNYTYDYDTFTDRFTLPPLLSPLGTRSTLNEDDDAKKSDTLAGSILVKDSAIMEEVDDECRIRRGTQFAINTLVPITAREYCPLIGGGSGVAWPAMVLGGGAAPAPAPAPSPAPAPAPARAPRAPHSHSASSLQLRAPPPPPRHQPLFSSSTSELEKLKRNSSRMLPALSRHRNREHLHLSDEQLHLPRAPPAPAPAPCPAPAPAPALAPEPRLFQDPLRSEEGDKKRVRCAACRKRLSIATTHTCRCGARTCAPHRYAEAHACRRHAPPHAPPLHPHNPRAQAPKLPKI